MRPSRSSASRRRSLLRSSHSSPALAAKRQATAAARPAQQAGPDSSSAGARPAAAAADSQSLVSRVLSHPLFLRAASLVIVIGAWEYAWRVPLSPAFPPFLGKMYALVGILQHVHKPVKEYL